MDAPHVGGLGGTFGGNPVACAAALATIDTIEADGLIERARQIERLMKDRLLALQAADDRIGDVRGRGAMIAVEFVKPDTAEPDADVDQGAGHRRPRRRCHRVDGGTFGNVVRFLPPLTHQRRTAQRRSRRAGRPAGRPLNAFTPVSHLTLSDCSALRKYRYLC